MLLAVLFGCVAMFGLTVAVGLTYLSIAYAGWLPTLALLAAIAGGSLGLYIALHVARSRADTDPI